MRDRNRRTQMMVSVGFCGFLWVSPSVPRPNPNVSHGCLARVAFCRPASVPDGVRWCRAVPDGCQLGVRWVSDGCQMVSAGVSNGVSDGCQMGVRWVCLEQTCISDRRGGCGVRWVSGGVGWCRMVSGCVGWWQSVSECVGMCRSVSDCVGGCRMGGLHR